MTFFGCSSLTTAPVIPESVTNLSGTFSGCTALTGTIIINATLGEYQQCQEEECSYCTYNGYECQDCPQCSPYGECFARTVNPIVLTGSCDKLEDLAATAENGNVTVQ